MGNRERVELRGYEGADQALVRSYIRELRSLSGPFHKRHEAVRRGQIAVKGADGTLSEAASETVDGVDSLGDRPSL